MFGGRWAFGARPPRTRPTSSASLSGSTQPQSPRRSKGHGRLEERQIRVSSEVAGYNSWPYLVQVFEYIRTWTAKGVSKQQVRYGITSLPADVGNAARPAIVKRGHWQVENGLHYVRDVTPGEDASQTHVGNAADVFAMVWNIAISLIRVAGHRDIEAQLQRYSGCLHEALALLGICVVENAEALTPAKFELAKL